MRIDPAPFARAYLDRLAAVLPEPGPHPDREDERTAAVLSAREEVNRLRSALEARPPQETLARAADLATSVGFQASLPGVYGSGYLALILAEEAAGALVPGEVERRLGDQLHAGTMQAPSSDPEACSRAGQLARQIGAHAGVPFQVHVFSGDHTAAASVPGHVYLSETLLNGYPAELSALVLGREVAHLEQRDSLKSLGRSSLLEQCAEAAPDLNLDRNLMWLRRAADESARQAESAADARGGELTQAAGWSRERAVEQLDPALATFSPQLEARSRRRLAADQASRVLGYSPLSASADRRTLGEQIGALRRRHEVGTQEMAQACAALRRALDDTDDPISERMAWEFLAARSPWGELENLALTYGDLEGSAKLLARVEDLIPGLHLSSKPPDYPVARALQILGLAHPTTQGLRVVAQLANTAHTYQGPCAEQAAGWGSQAGDLLQSWWAHGALQVDRDGRRLEPGELDLARAVQENRVAVEGLTVRLKSSRAPGPVVQEILEQIPAQEYVGREFPPAPGLDRLLELSPAEAGDLVGELLEQIDPAGSRAGLSRMVQLLARAGQDEGLRELLRPHLGQLRELTQEALSRGALAREYGQSSWHVAYYDDLVRLFPEALDRDLVDRQIAPLLQSDHYDLPCKAAPLVGRWLGGRPDLVAPVMEQLTRAHPGVPLREEMLRLVDQAFHQQGWRPDDRQLSWMASRLYQPPTLRASSLFTDRGPRRQEFPFFLKMLGELERERPGVLDALELPDPEGGMADLKSSVFERVLTDDFYASPEKLFAVLEKGDHEMVAPLYALVRPETRVDELIAIVARGLSQAQFVFDLKGKEQAALGVLAHLARADRGLESRLRPLLSRSEGTMGREMRAFLEGVKSCDRIEEGVRQLALGTAEGGEPGALTARTRTLLKWADLSLHPEDVAAQRERVLRAWMQGLARDHAGSKLPEVVEYFPALEQALDAVEYLEGQRLPDLEQGWQTYRAMLTQTRGDVKTAQAMFETERSLNEPSGSATIHRGEKAVRIGVITLKVRGG